MARRAISAPIVRRRYAADAEDGGHATDVCPTSKEDRCSRCNGLGHTADVCPSSKEDAVLAVSTKAGATDDEGDGSAQASAFKVEETGECGDGSGRMEEGEST